MKKGTQYVFLFLLGCSEDRDRTYDLRVMSPTSYRCSTSRDGCKDTATFLTKQKVSYIKYIVISKSYTVEKTAMWFLCLNYAN